MTIRLDHNCISLIAVMTIKADDALPVTTSDTTVAVCEVGQETT